MKLRSLLLLSSFAGLGLAATARAEKILPLANGDFEAQLTGWNAANDNGMSAVSAEAARAGKAGLRVTDASDSLGSSVASKRFPATPGKTYEARRKPVKLLERVRRNPEMGETRAMRTMGAWLPHFTRTPAARNKKPRQLVGAFFILEDGAHCSGEGGAG